MSKLSIEGEVEEPLELGHADLAALPGQVPDLSVELPGRAGGGVRLVAILDRARPTAAATHATLISADARFSASVALEELRDALVAYRLGDAALAPTAGGPFRFFIPLAEGCALEGASRCANVKALAVIRLTAGPAEDARPRTDAEHQRLHRHSTRSAEG